MIDDAINIWSEMLSDDEPAYIAKAVKEYIKTDATGYPPSIGQIRAIAKDIRAAELREQQIRVSKLPEPDGVPMPQELKERMEGLFTCKMK
jgi:hypothetical protein